jgi:hypothetical protein
MGRETTYYPPTGGGVSTPSPGPAPYTPSTMSGVLRRSDWATVQPIPSRMDKLTGISRITVHHDGMQPFYETNQRACAYRIDAIARSHQGSKWGDIGYHYVVDPAGRIWEGRPLVFQGAHVKYNNPGNIGVVCLGNYDRQDFSERQARSLSQHVRRLQATYSIPVHRVYTHQELRATACPGRSLQRFMVSARSNGLLG